jgi:Tfp pilus assembly protein PilF
MIQYHLGMALLKSGDKANARKKLEAALVIDNAFPEAGNAKAALASI